MAGYLEGSAGEKWRELTSFIESSFKTKSQIDYSTCSEKPGWNLKYKVGSKALCTLYPEKDCFIALVVLGTLDQNFFAVERVNYNDYIRELYDDCPLFNGTKWLIIRVADDSILANVKQLIKLKVKRKAKENEQS